MTQVNNTCTCVGCKETGTPSLPWTAPHVPLAVLGELISEWKKRNGNETEGRAGQVEGTKAILSQLTGIPVRRMWAMERGVDTYTAGSSKKRTSSSKKSVTKVISFHIADKLVCGMGLCPVETWNYGRLAKYYGPIALSGAERQMEKEAA